MNSAPPLAPRHGSVTNAEARGPRIVPFMELYPCHSLQVSVSKAESKQAFATIDSDGSGKISFDEFLPWFSKLSSHR